MKRAIFSVLLLASIIAHGQNIYTKTFGNTNNRAVIFLHGGPGYNSASFEATTAQKLADKGFFVIVYDRRGEGRSIDANATFSFAEAFNDLNKIYEAHNLSKAVLIGHSFGGVIATLFAEANPKKTQSVILVSAPISMQETFKNIIAKSRAIYQARNDSANLNYLDVIDKMDTKSLEYSSYCFAHAVQNGFYTTAKPTDEAKVIYKSFGNDAMLVQYATQMTSRAPQGFWTNEKYTTLDITNNVGTLLARSVKVFGLYGKDDGLFSAQQVNYYQSALGPKKVLYWDSCSHNVFIDQQVEFINAVYNWAK